MGKMLSVLLVGVMLAAAVAVAEETSFWTGKQRTEIVEMIGEPTKSKKSADGSEVMTYKLSRLREGAIPPSGMLLLNLPEVGRVGRVLGTPGPRVDSMNEPSGLDEDGRLVAGAPSGTQSSSVSWSREDGVERSTDMPYESATKGKVKLTFKLDPDGRVISWSMSPKKKKKD